MTPWLAAGVQHAYYLELLRMSVRCISLLVPSRRDRDLRELIYVLHAGKENKKQQAHAQHNPISNVSSSTCPIQQMYVFKNMSTKKHMIFASTISRGEELNRPVSFFQSHAASTPDVSALLGPWCRSPPGG